MNTYTCGCTGTDSRCPMHYDGELVTPGAATNATTDDVLTLTFQMPRYFTSDEMRDIIESEAANGRIVVQFCKGSYVTKLNEKGFKERIRTIEAKLAQAKALLEEIAGYWIGEDGRCGGRAVEIAREYLATIGIDRGASS